MANSIGAQSLLIRGVAALALIVFSSLSAASARVASAGAHVALATPVFPGAHLGTPSGAAPTPASFFYNCTVAPNADPAKAGGTTLASGTAIQASGGCGQAVLYLNAPASGHFQAAFAVADAASGSSSVLRLFLLASGGFLLRTMDVQAAKGTAAHVDFDVSGGVMLALTFPTTTASVLYGLKLTGLARALAATPLTGSGLPAGGAPVPSADVHLDCNASVSTTQSTVSDLVISATGSQQLGGCGKVTVRIPAPAKGALALRYGVGDLSNYSSLPTEVGLRVLDAAGHLLRKSIGLTYLGSGFQPIWVNLQGGSTATFTLDGGNTNVHLVVAGLSFLPSAVAPHHNPDHQEYGSPSGGSIPITPDAVVSICNASQGTADTTVNHQLVLRDNYLAVGDCGIAELIMTDAHGSFSAKIGVADGSDGKTITAHLVVLDQNSKPLTTRSVTAKLGHAAVTIVAGIAGASIVQLTFSSKAGNARGILYALQLAGHATLYDRVFPPSEPPVSTKGGAVIDPRSFTVSCSLTVATQDFALIHQVALEQWSLYINGCGSAILSIAALHGRHGTFSALYGIPLQSPSTLIAHLQLTVLDAKGKTVRQATFVARAGYGPRRAAISLVGGSKLQITSPDSQRLVVFALTAS
jgi:hypothetical protein